MESYDIDPERIKTENVDVELIDDDLILEGENWRISLNVQKIKAIREVKVINGFQIILYNELGISWGRDGKLWIKW